MPVNYLNHPVYYSALFRFKHEEYYSGLEGGSKKLDYYYQLKPGFTAVPSELHPLCYTDDKYKDILSEVIKEQDIKTVTLDSFLDYLAGDRFISRVFRHWLADYAGPVPQCLEDLREIDFFSVSDPLPIPEGIKYRIVRLFSSFEIVRNTLIRTFQEIYAVMVKFRKNKERLIETGKKRFNHIDFQRKLANDHSLDFKEYDYTIELIHSVDLWFDSLNQFVAIGINNYENNISTLKDVNVESFAIAYGDETRIKIIELIIKNGMMCMNDLVEHLNIKQPAIYHHISILQEEGMIKIAKSVNRKYYYAVNVDYFKKVAEKFKEDLENLLEQ